MLYVLYLEHTEQREHPYLISCSVSYQFLAQSSLGRTSGGVLVLLPSLVAAPVRLLWAVTASVPCNTGYPATQGTLQRSRYRVLTAIF